MISLYACKLLLKYANFKKVQGGKRMRLKKVYFCSFEDMQETQIFETFPSKGLTFPYSAIYVTSNACGQYLN